MFFFVFISMATINAAAQQSWDQNSGEYYQNYDYSQYDQSGYYSGQYYDGQNYDYSNYYSESGDTATTSTSGLILLINIHHCVFELRFFLVK